MQMNEGWYHSLFMTVRRGAASERAYLKQYVDRASDELQAAPAASRHAAAANPLLPAEAFINNAG
jgi:hypothetical protein